MKRFLAILLVMLMLCGTCLLTACGGSGDDTDKDSGTNATTGGNTDGGNKDDATQEKADLYTIVNNAITKMDTATSFEANMVLTMDGTVMGMENDIDSDLVIKANNDKMSVAGTVKANAYGSEIETDMEYYFDGSYVYMQMYGEGYKMPCSLDEFESEYSGTDELFTDLPKELFEGLEGDGSNVVLTLDEAACEELFGDTITELCYDIVGEDLTQVAVKNAKITLSVKDGYLSTFNLEFTCEMGSGDATATYVYKQDCTFTNIGGDVTVTPPEGYEDFMLMDEG